MASKTGPPTSQPPTSTRRPGFVVGDQMSALRSAPQSSTRRSPTWRKPRWSPERRSQVRRRRLVLVGIVVAVVILVTRSLGGSPKPVQVSAKRPAPTVPSTAATTLKRGRPLDIMRFSPGACMSLPPTLGDRHQTVFVDAGHGGIDPGAIGVTGPAKPFQEADLTLPVELDTMALLRGQGFTVVVSRTGDSSVARLGAGRRGRRRPDRARCA